MSDKDGGPAFPSHGSMGEVTHEGMTLRDHYAGLAMQALIAKSPSVVANANGRLIGDQVPISETECEEISAGVSVGAYDYADAMLKERAKK